MGSIEFIRGSAPLAAPGGHRRRRILLCPNEGRRILGLSASAPELRLKHKSGVWLTENCVDQSERVLCLVQILLPDI